MPTRMWVTWLFVALAGALTPGAGAQEVLKKANSVAMAAIPDAPQCFVAAVEQGNPGAEPSIMLMKGKAGCAVPWHWHPATENIMMVSGTAETQVKDQPSVRLARNDFMSVPPKHAMRFVCLTECSLFVATDGAFSIHYVDAAGKEITPAQALGKK